MHVVESLCAPRDESANLARLLREVARTARDTIPRTDYASFLIRYSDGHLQTIAGTGPAVAPLDGLQSRLREGPGYDAVTYGRVTASGDLANDTEWPAYGSEAAKLGFRSQLSMRVHDGPRASIALNLYARDWAAFAHPRQAANVLVTYAEAALAAADDQSRITLALLARQEQGQAAGILMEERCRSERMERVTS